jgi:hypothetical protein
MESPTGSVTHVSKPCLCLDFGVVGFTGFWQGGAMWEGVGSDGLCWHGLKCVRRRDRASQLQGGS